MNYLRYDKFTEGVRYYSFFKILYSHHTAYITL